MVLVSILKRKDGASLVVGVIIAMIVVQVLPGMTAELSGKLLGLEAGEYLAYSFPNGGWVATYVQPVLSALLQLLLLEAIARVYIWVAGGSNKKK
jgi:hypothetical protein